MVALYIHWPFCLSKCPYCDFNSHVRENVDAAVWQEALLSELRWTHAQQESHAPVSSIFFGGGTPSLMPPKLIATLINEAERLWGLDANCEITLEANPTSIEIGKFTEFRAAGVNRVSIGVQSLRPEALKFLGREHDVDEARRAIAIAAQAFDRYSFDLIYARPDQTPQQWQEELQEALQMAGHHLSLYQLTIEPGTQFWHHHASGKLTVIDEDEAAELYELTQDIMEAAGRPAYEVSNHARPGEESRHNLAYWQGRCYLGIGPGAHGRWQNGEQRQATINLRSPEKWLQAVQTHGHGQQECTQLDAQTVQEEQLLMGLRLKTGLDLTDFPLPEKSFQPLISEGLLTRQDSCIIPTRRGWLVLGSVTAHLAGYLP